MNILTVVGARPQFIKAAAVSRVLRKKHNEYLVHTGQHYDKNMSDIFFLELDIPKPDINLEVGSDTHARQTAAILVGIEDILLARKPDMVLLYGDTNSTMAGAIAAAKLCIPIAHVEAGVRGGYKDMPEEQNRIVTDHLATWNFAPSQIGVNFLAKEGITDKVFNVGDVMVDALLYYGNLSDIHDGSYYMARLAVIDEKRVLPDKYYLATIHRPENTDNILLYKDILEALELLDFPVIYPVHPRTRNLLKELDAIKKYKNIIFIEPLGYVDMIWFTRHAIKVITDSGGLHKEAYVQQIPGVVILRGTGWNETLKGNWNVLASPKKEDILAKVYDTKIDKEVWQPHYGDGKAAEKIVEILS